MARICARLDERDKPFALECVHVRESAKEKP